ncbi:major histocompatibility complex class I-related protein 1-like [Alosa pseudoharengus]|uniref:major histocompatibility complex class I-related protein 1-like n=1 Tax=Alosa pseudoharengus TaxID=34774 RepID=UPI003F8B2694
MLVYCAIAVSILLFNQSCLAGIHSLRAHGLASLGTSSPKSINMLILDDIVVYYYSPLKETPMPKWLKSSDGVLLWEEIQWDFQHNRLVLDKAVNLTSKHFSNTHAHFYQGYSQCEFNPEDEYMSAAVSHGYNGKDFVSFDVKSRTWVAAVPEAWFYKRKREEKSEDLLGMIHSYEYRCFKWLKKLLNFSQEDRKEKVPNVELVEKSSPGTSNLKVTCHVTGFYPREVRVEWLDERGHKLVDGVISEEVLPNGDGTYQVRRTLKVPDEAPWSQIYRCQVVHSSVTGNITVVLDRKRSFTALIVGCSIGLIIVTVLILVIYVRRRQCHQNTPHSRAAYMRTTTDLNLPSEQSTEQESFSPQCIHDTLYTMHS